MPKQVPTTFGFSVISKLSVELINAGILTVGGAEPHSTPPPPGLNQPIILYGSGCTVVKPVKRSTGLSTRQSVETIELTDYFFHATYFDALWSVLLMCFQLITLKIFSLRRAIHPQKSPPCGRLVSRHFSEKSVVYFPFSSNFP